MLDPLYQSNTDLNRQIDIIEVRCVVNKSKANKSAGIDELPYIWSLKIWKCYANIALIFDTNKTLFIWRRAIISQNLKDKSLDPRILLNYRGISMQFVAAKVYSSVPNSRLTAYLEDNEPLVNEQNGFWRQTSCLDHIFPWTVSFRTITQLLSLSLTYRKRLTLLIDNYSSIVFLPMELTATFTAIFNLFIQIQDRAFG